MKKTVNFIIVLSVILFSCVSNNENTDTNSNKAAEQSETKVKYDKKITCSVQPEDKQKFLEIMKYADKNNLSSKSLSEIEPEVAKQLLGLPYVAHTLEIDSVEQLVINLRELDCTTFVENVVALSKSIKNKQTDFNDYCSNLLNIRYRKGKIENYTSRLHYFTEWLLDNEKKGIIEIISNKYGDADFDASVNFMSEHSDKYKRLKNKPKLIKQIAKYEDSISDVKFKYFTPEGLLKNINKIHDGDVIAYATSIDGLDISHVAIARFKNGKLHFYHASSAKKEVVLSEKTIFDYLKSKKKNYGVLVARIITD